MMDKETKDRIKKGYESKFKLENQELINRGVPRKERLKIKSVQKKFMKKHINPL